MDFTQKRPRATTRLAVLTAGGVAGVALLCGGCTPGTAGSSAAADTSTHSTAAATSTSAVTPSSSATASGPVATPSPSKKKATPVPVPSRIATPVARPTHLPRPCPSATPSLCRPKPPPGPRSRWPARPLSRPRVPRRFPSPCRALFPGRSRPALPGLRPVPCRLAGSRSLPGATPRGQRHRARPGPGGAPIRLAGLAGLARRGSRAPFGDKQDDRGDHRPEGQGALGPERERGGEQRASGAGREVVGVA